MGAQIKIDLKTKKKKKAKPRKDAGGAARPDLAADVREAAKAGISYGKYKQRQMLSEAGWISAKERKPEPEPLGGMGGGKG